jgi:hypothetical protein
MLTFLGFDLAWNSKFTEEGRFLQPPIDFKKALEINERLRGLNAKLPRREVAREKNCFTSASHADHFINLQRPCVLCKDS